MRTTAKILIVKSGTTNPPVVEKHGDYDFWFQRSLAHHAIQWSVVSVYDDEALPSADDFDGIILTGSPASVWENEPWMRRTIEWLQECIQMSTTPILGVCFGHQLLGQALGGTVVPNPKGAEYGTIEVELSPEGTADRLFDGLTSPLRVQSIHRDIVVDLPMRTGLTPLGRTENTHCQAFAFGAHVRAVQFHPELPEAALKMLCALREVPANVGATSQGARILDNWFRYWVGNRNPIG